MKYLPSIGIEVHAELNTESKMFCDCKNDPDEKHPNHNICPVCLAHPGTLPVPNKKAIESIIMIGMAVGGEISSQTKFDRKNYFYPDLPKGYQISQYDMPIVRGGMLRDVQLTRIHLEEDTGRLIHAPALTRGRQNGKASFVDFNRAGIPLMELVTEPHLQTAEEARAFAEELHLLLRYLNVSNADMEKGEMRIEVNVSIRPEGQDVLGTKVEVKNINSFKAAESAIRYEIDRQTHLLETGKKIAQETRGWEDNKKITKSQRSKEEAHDYRYLPEPDIPQLELASFGLERLRRELPELPDQKRARFQSEYGLSENQVKLLIQDRALAQFFEESVSEIKSQDKEKTVAILFNYLSSDFLGLLAEQKTSFAENTISPAHFADLVSLATDGTLSSRMTKDILKRMMETGQDPHQIITTEGLIKIADEEQIEAAVREVLADQDGAVKEYKSGKTTVLRFLIGKTMGHLSGKGDPEMIKKVLERILSQ